MADSPEETDSLTTDDGQLIIRIPNPKVYMARQSQWIGRRGKPRCDHCRRNNLKARGRGTIILRNVSHHHTSYSVTESYQAVITAHGQAGENANILPYRRPLIAVFPDATVAV
jgi:hypothetical protein